MILEIKIRLQISLMRINKPKLIFKVHIVPVLKTLIGLKVLMTNMDKLIQ